MLNGLVILRKMHPVAKNVLVSEIVCDVVHTIFFGGTRFTYAPDKWKEDILPETTPIGMIQQELQKRLGSIPLAPSGQSSVNLQRSIIDMLTTNQLIFHRQDVDGIIYAMRNDILHPNIASGATEPELSEQLRIFAHLTHRHHSFVRRVVGQEHTTYKRRVGVFLDSIATPVALTCLTWLGQQTTTVLKQKAAVRAHMDAQAAHLLTTAQNGPSPGNPYHGEPVAAT